MSTIKDKSGRELKAGDYIVYGHALGRCAGLRYGVVIDIKEARDSWTDKKKMHLRVRGVDDDWGGQKPELLSKDSTLQFGDRILRINPSQMPEKVLAILQKFEQDRQEG